MRASRSTGPTIPASRRWSLPCSRPSTGWTSPTPTPSWCTRRSPTRCSRPGWPRTAGRSCRSDTWSAWGPRPSTPSRSGPGRSASCRGPRTTGPSWKRSPTTGAGSPDVDRVVLRPIPETAARIAALLKGEIDLMMLLPPDHLERVNQHPTTRSVSMLSSVLYVMAVNSKVPPLNNPLVKQALSLAVDREAIVKELWRGRAVVPNGPIVKGDNHYDPSLPPLPYDPRRPRSASREPGTGASPSTSRRPATSSTRRRCPRRSPPCGRTSGSTPSWR